MLEMKESYDLTIILLSYSNWSLSVPDLVWYLQPTHECGVLRRYTRWAFVGVALECLHVVADIYVRKKIFLGCTTVVLPWVRGQVIPLCARGGTYNFTVSKS